MRKMIALVVVLSVVGVSTNALAQSSKEICIRSAQLQLASCQKDMPPNVTAKDSKNPTESEKEAMKRYTAASNACNEKGQKAMAVCK